MADSDRWNGLDRRRSRGWRRLIRENWYRDIWLLAITGLALATIVIGYTQNAARIADQARATVRIEQARRDSLETFCRESQRQNAAIIQFLEDLHARPATLARARALFPTGQDCAKQAQRRAPTP